jgi:predicted 3-demethylubiquinone-9 3-methyltransferase (glyoxalase superfamily)
MYGDFTAFGQWFAAMDSAREHGFGFNEAVSLMIECDTQAEIDRYWKALSAVPEAEQCGWLKDRFGVSWQVTPSVLPRMLKEGSPEQVARVTEAFMEMKKLDAAALERAYTSAG